MRDDQIKTFEFQGYRVDVFYDEHEGYYSQAHMHNVIPSTMSFKNQEDAENAGKCLVLGYVYALYDAQRYVQTEMNSLLSKLVHLR